MDYAEPPCSIEGRYPYILAVRDLASGQQLLWLPMTEATAASTQTQLLRLFACYLYDPDYPGNFGYNHDAFGTPFA